MPGAKPKLEGKALDWLYRTITLSNPQQFKFEFALWTRAMVRELIRRQFNVAMSEVSVGRLLRKLGLSPQRPLMRAYQRDPALVTDWITHEFPRIRAQAKAAGADIFFGDEADAVRIANNSIYGLSGAVFGGQDRALAIARRQMQDAVETGRRPGRIYKKTGRPCFRCRRARIRSRGQGDDNRTTYWCPNCQS